MLPVPLRERGVNLATYRIEYTDRTRDIQTVQNRQLLKHPKHCTVKRIKRVG